LVEAFRIAIALMALSPLTAVYAQHASDDPLATANDAFGLTLGLESIGLYGPWRLFAASIRRRQAMSASTVCILINRARSRIVWWKAQRSVSA
jgi:hypothetical protein